LVARSVLQLVQKEIEARARLRVDLGETAPVRGNEARLVQVILNLVVNAMQALPEDEPECHEIALRTYNDDKQVVLEVSDTGPGVPYERREHIFEPFVSTKEIGVGTGLGLFVSRNIVRSFGGDIVLVDQPHGGALFRVTLPPYSRSRPPLGSEPGAAIAGGKNGNLGRVLVIDDESLVAQVLCAHLASAGYTAHSEQDARRALHTLSEDPEGYDLVFCDLMMKGMTGMELSDALKAHSPQAHAKVVFMTGGAFTPKARAFLEAHAAQCVEKPFDVLVETERRLRKLRR
jgi:CheY-like chemotaxis protein